MCSKQGELYSLQAQAGSSIWFTCCCSTSHPCPPALPGLLCPTRNAR
jgi:hypothetical protein